MSQADVYESAESSQNSNAEQNVEQGPTRARRNVNIALQHQHGEGGAGTDEQGGQNGANNANSPSSVGGGGGGMANREKRAKAYPKRESNSNKYIRQTSYNTPKGAKSKPLAAKRKGDEKYLDKKEKKYGAGTSSNAAGNQSGAVAAVGANTTKGAANAQAHPIFLYRPDAQLPDLQPYLNQTIEIRISKKFISRDNKNVIQRQIWGSDVYTSNSDAVCQLVHSGRVTFDDENLRDPRYEGVQYLVKVQRPRRNYQGTNRNGIASRVNKRYTGHVLRPEGHQWLRELGKTAELQDAASRMACPHGRKRVKMEHVPNYKMLIPIPEVNIVFNMNNEPAYKFSITNICDKSSDYHTWTSYKLKTQVLYLETDSERFEIARIDTFGEKSGALTAAPAGKAQDRDENNEGFPNGANTGGSNDAKEEQNDVDEDINDDVFKEWDQYRLSRVLNPLNADNAFMETVLRPLPAEHTEIIYSDLHWDKFLWGSNSLQVKDRNIEGIRSFKYYSRV